MQVNVQKLSPVLVELEVLLPPERVKTEIDNAYVVLQRQSKVRGFRPGHAPRDVLAHLFGERVAADVAQRLVDDSLPKALGEAKVDALYRLAVEPQKVRPGTGFSYRARFEVRPDIEAVSWEGLEIDQPSADIGAGDVDAELERMRKEHATLQAPDPPRPARAGDVVSLRFDVEVDGKTVEDASHQEAQAELGRSELIPAIEKALEGASAGDVRRVEVQFAADHAHPALRGREATFVVTLDAIKERVLADLDDEFAKDVSSFSTLADLRADVEARLRKAAAGRAEETLAERLVARLCERNPIPLPPTLVEQQLEALEQELVARVPRQRRTPVPPEVREKLRAESETKVRAALLMTEIAKAQKVQVGDEDIERALAELAAEQGKQVAKIRAEYRDPKKRQMLVAMIVEDKVLDIVKAKAKIT